MSDTPRTDAAAYQPEFLSESVFADFARELERENARLREALAELRRWVGDGDCSDDAGIWPGFATTAYKEAVKKADDALSGKGEP